MSIVEKTYILKGEINMKLVDNRLNRREFSRFDVKHEAYPTICGRILKARHLNLTGLAKQAEFAA